MIIHKALMFPENSRQFPGKRWLKITLRSLHLLGLAGTGTVFIFDQAIPGALYYLYLVIVTGLAMVLLDIWSNGIWIYQLRGQVIILKLILFTMIFITPEYAPHLFIAIVLLSGVISHASGNVRYYSIIHKKRLNSVNEKG